MPNKMIKLSPGELELLEILWCLGPASISGVHQEFLNRGRKIGYPTVQTRLNRLAEKGIVQKNGQYPTQYEAVLNQNDISGHYYELFDTLCGGNLTPLMLHLAGKRKLLDSEIKILKKIIEQNDEQQDEKKRREK